MMSRYRREIIAVLVIKIVLILTIRMIWFSDRPPISDQAVASRLLAAPAAAENGSKEHP
ncbi:MULTISPECIES: cytochrome oxidase putative small subunit CydP [unclassified Paludibacterium]|uniref:cytochrome oxidase putative small subunit CydP n=1 Tax=unclassified Paludibacterium TaxID=2618429 RepID=UPI001C05748C|nr:cytochrome oxidase putative small subunit CydP [Paludibacterium sp. B53371]